MPLDLHRGGHGDDPLVVLIPHLDDDIAEITPCEPACANLSRRASHPSDGRVQAVELGALVITQEVRSMPDIEIVASHIHLLSQGVTPDQMEGFRVETKSLLGLGILYRDRAGGYVPGSRRW